MLIIKGVKSKEVMIMSR